MHEFISSSMNDDLLFHAVPLHDGVHSAINPPILLFIRNLRQKRTYYYSFGHPDVKTFPEFGHKEVVEMFNGMKGIKWAVDKKSFMHMIPLQGLLDVGFAEYVRENKVFELCDFETSAHTLVRRNLSGRLGYGKFVPHETS